MAVSHERRPLLGISCVNTFALQPNHVTAATDTIATIEQLLEAVFRMRLALELYTDERGSHRFHPCGGGVEYLHRSPTSRRRRRKGKSRI
jgi:hypothetical protein